MSKTEPTKYIIQGNAKIGGTIRACGNKNAALPCIAAALLTEEKIILRNIPEIQDVTVILDILKSLRVQVRQMGPEVYEIHAGDTIDFKVPEEQAELIRASILLAGPLLARRGRVLLPPPGGDVIGRRRLDTHFLVFEALGASVKTDGLFTITAPKLLGTDLFLDEASVTATENAVMAAVLAEGQSVIRNAASEPHVQDLCRMLISMGARISGVGSNLLKIQGVKKLHGTDYSIGSDFMEVGSFIGLAAVTRGDLVIENTCPEDLRMTKLAFGKLGISWETEGNTIYVPQKQSLKVVPDFGGAIPKIDDAPWPGFPADLTSIITVVATQVEGTVLIHEKLFESRMFFVDKLIGMGAGIILCDPHRAVISGPSRLRGSYLVSPDVRAGMAMVIAALCAEGQSVIGNVYQIERGYQNLVERLRGLGAKIDRVENSSPDQPTRLVH